MVKGNTGTLTMRLVRNKLRKRDEQRAESAITIEANEHQGNEDYCQPASNSEDSKIQTTETSNTTIKDTQHVTFLRTSGETAGVVGHANDISEWTFPPKAPAPHIYHINPEMLVANEKTSFRGFRKQFSGRFKRLVARKLEPAPVIPPELKPQLKSIYVY